MLGSVLLADIRPDLVESLDEMMGESAGHSFVGEVVITPSSEMVMCGGDGNAGTEAERS